MFNEGAPEFVVDQGLYYPTATNYGYFCTGFESPSDWDDHHRVFGLDGQDVLYSGAQTENFPFVYYTPSYGYAQSPYNPYNPYIPGAMVGVDGPFVGAQQYYTFPSYENHTSSPSYLPMIVQSRSDIIASNTPDHFIETTASTANRADGSGLKHHRSSASPALTSTTKGPASSRTNSSTRVAEGKQSSVGSSKRSMTKGNVTSGGFPNPASSPVLQNGGAQGIENVSCGKVLPGGGHLKVPLSYNNGFPGFGSSTGAQVSADRVQPKFIYGRILNEPKVNPDASSEQNQAPKLDKSKTQLIVKAYTTRTGVADAQGNITIYLDQYNKNDFPVDYVNAKFFVIKSYSEDDVHKSIKYNVWSSTPNGNKKLNHAYEDARRLAVGDPVGCPVFLFFSVNASGQFCGVAEMTGSVDFHKDMDFWQQDKWNGSFPVKWHIIKDVPNPNFRHIILENNDNKPVTNSRDTQEIRYRKGIEMLKIFKSYASKTSLLDDFMYYENRQKIMQEEKAKLLMNNYDNPFLVPVLDPPRKLVVDLPCKEEDRVSKKDLNSSDKNDAAPPPGETIGLDGNESNLSPTDRNIPVLSNGEASLETALKIGSLTITTKQSVPEALDEVPTSGSASNSASSDVVTVGSLPVKVNRFAESSGFLVGTIPLDPKAFE
ncbi:hypothetical protein M9H77_37005 [Catharanthus roseus]|uniref:Uncharacterized protein n=1 Tax=Catharanthus roseus TaxID=4058 RepID=A0ACB9ZUA1_CATRO|nr:hypothetical protein M9H77_37005 [Catharanthus roseus]